MAGNNRITYTLDFKSNFKDFEGQLNSLKNSLNSLVGKNLSIGGGASTELQKASQAAISLQGHLKKALDPNTGKLDLTRLQTQLNASGQSAKSLMNNLLQGGKEGAQAFLQVGNALVSLLTNWGDLFARMGSNKFNKSSILMFIKELTLLTTPEIRMAMKKYKTAYQNVRKKLLDDIY